MAARIRNERNPIRAKCRNAVGAKLGDLTVLSHRVDPYRFDTTDGHKQAHWFREQLLSCVAPDRSIHLRGLHYAIVIRGNIVKPDGEVYTNSEGNWKWLSEDASKAARWLAYVPFDRITDNRNDAPEFTPAEDLGRPYARLTTSFDAYVPHASEISVDLRVERFTARQPYKLALFGEKSSLAEILQPLARRYQADLYLPSGEISDTLVYTMAKRGAEDGRPMVVFTLSDFDPAGFQMPISIGRKLQALRDLYFPKLDFRVVPVGLSMEQAIELNLPSTPLKQEEKRADRWREAFSREQTEIDAALILYPDALRRFVREAVQPYFDSSLDRRVIEAKQEWLENGRQSLPRNCRSPSRPHPR